MQAHDIEEIKERIQKYVDANSATLIKISQTIHANPEVAFEEFQSMAMLADAVDHSGYQVLRGVAGLETAFVATSQSDQPGPTVAFIAEYDALPGLGHACGHNIIGTAATGAAMAIQSVRADLPGTVKLIGTPAEERGGGKVIMAEHGVFEDLDAAMMVHPSSKGLIRRGSLASNKLELEFFGKSAHAAAAPDLGINALDACIQTFNNINALRQHLTPDVRIHGIITHGGDAPNIVPEYASASFSVRAATSERSFAVLAKVIRCAEAGAMAAGAELKYRHLTHYANRISNPTMATLFANNMASLGQELQIAEPGERMGSSDMGNVSQLVPSIHPYVPIAAPGTGGHTPAFAEAAASKQGDETLLRSAKAMAMTAVDLLTGPQILAQAQSEFTQTIDMDAPWRQRRFFT